MAITIVNDIVDKTFINNPVNLRVTSDRNIDFDFPISSIGNTGGKVLFITTAITSSGGILTVGDTILLDGFTNPLNTYLNGLYGMITNIAGTYSVTTDIDYVTGGIASGNPRYYRKNNNFEIKTDVRLKFGSGSFFGITGPSSKTVDGANFDFDVSKYLKLLYSQNVGANETLDISYPVTSSAAIELDLPYGRVTFTEYFDDADGLQKVGSSGTGITALLHDGVYMPNDILDKGSIFIDGLSPNMEGRMPARMTRNLSKAYHAVEFVSLVARANISIRLYASDGSSVATYSAPTVVNKKMIIPFDSSDLAQSSYFIATLTDSTTLTVLWSGVFYFSPKKCPNYVIKFKNDLGGWEYADCGLVKRGLEADKSNWEKKLSFPYVSTDYGSKNMIQRSDDILEVETQSLVDPSEIAPLFETESIFVYDVENNITMHGRVIDKKFTFQTNDIGNAQFKINLNRRV